MTPTWKFTDLEFYALWYAATGEGLPWPFYFTTQVETDEEFRRQRADALNELRRTLDPAFDAVKAALIGPDLWVAVNGWDARSPREPESLLRVLGVRLRDHSYLVTQLPGETYWDASGFTVTEGDALALADAVVDCLPATEAGRQADVTIATTEEAGDVDYAYGLSRVHEARTDTVAERALQFLAGTVASTGTVDIVQGRSLFGPRGVVRYRLEWRDLVDDGRYVIADQHPPVATATDRKRLVTMINTRIAAVVHSIKDERV